MVATLTEKRNRFCQEVSRCLADPHDYQRPRYYNPAVARFTELDPFDGRIKEPLTLHKYAYAGNNPVMHSDPTGQDFTLSGMMTTGAMIGGLTGMVGGSDS